MVKQAVVNTAIKFIRQIPADVKVKKAYLFGSCAKGLEKEDSDIDIALIVESMTDFFSTQMQLMRTRRNVDLRIEPHSIDESDFIDTNPFAYEILSSGIEVMDVQSRKT